MRYVYFFLSLILIPSHGYCLDSDELYQDIRSDYRGLIIEDPNGKDPDRWKRVEQRLSQFLKTSVTTKTFPGALYLLGRLYEQRAKFLNDQQDIVDSLMNFNRVVNEYSDSDLVDDSLLGIARLKQQVKDPSEARQALNTIISNYPESDSVVHAKNQLSQLELLEKKSPDTSSIQEKDRISNEPRVLGNLEESKPLILIDAGHGGAEDGAIGPGDIREKDITLKLAFMVRDLLLQGNRVRVQLTRVEDETVKLSDRTKKANDVKADLFVSIHANASDYKSSRGVETYYLDNTDDKSSLRLAERENFSPSGSLNDSLSFIVSDFIQGIKMDDSITLAHSVQDALVGKLKIDYAHVKNLGVKRAPFYVLVGAHMPCILTEVSFIDHPEEGRLLATQKYQELISNGIFEGIVSFLKKKAKY